MRAGVVRGSFSVLTKTDFRNIRNWKKEQGLTDVYFDMIPPQGTDFARIELLNVYIKPYRHFHILSAEMDFTAEYIVSEDPSLKEGIVDDLPLKVRSLMIKHGIYRTEIAHHLLKPKRIRHVDSMTQLAVSLAQASSNDPQKALIAGLFHDGTKKWTEEQSYSLMKKCAPFALQRDPAVFHQYTGAYYLEHVLGYRDEDVLRAIRHHVDGDDPHDLSRIIYLADKLDPSRGYDSADMIEMAKKNLKKAVEAERKIQIEYLHAEGKEAV